MRAMPRHIGPRPARWGAYNHPIFTTRSPREECHGSFPSHFWYREEPLSRPSAWRQHSESRERRLAFGAEPAVSPAADAKNRTPYPGASMRRTWSMNTCVATRRDQRHRSRAASRSDRLKPARERGSSFTLHAPLKLLARSDCFQRSLLRERQLARLQIIASAYVRV